jgi:hypothetical protein
MLVVFNCQLIQEPVNIQASIENWTIRILVTGCWMLEKGVAHAAQAFAPRVALLIVIKSTEYLVKPVSRIQ